MIGVVYRSFRDQGGFCKRSEQLFYESCPACDQKLIMCRVYGGMCMSSKCREARLKVDERLGKVKL